MYNLARPRRGSLMFVPSMLVLRFGHLPSLLKLLYAGLQKM